MALLDSLPRLETERLNLRLLEPHEAILMVRFRIENRRHLEPWEPSRGPEFFTEAWWQIQLRANLRQFRQGVSVCFTLLDQEDREVIGVCNYTNIIRGTFQACHLGYALAEKAQGEGLMFEALKEANRYMLEDVGLHRIMANYMPRNRRSGDLLKRLGFVREGEAREFLKINGRWEDHILTSLINSRA